MCDGCNTSYHTDCLSELGKCAVAGCSRPFTGQISDGTYKGLFSKSKPKSRTRRGPELSPRSTSNIVGSKSGLSTKEKAWGAGTILLAVATFIGLCYIITYGIAFLAMFTG
jgi:hypothetical protein